MKIVGNFRKWQMLLTLAQELGTERSFARAVRAAERECGSMSPEVGLCLVELAECLENSGKIREAEAVTERYMEILYVIARGMGLGTKDAEGADTATLNAG